MLSISKIKFKHEFIPFFNRIIYFLWRGLNPDFQVPMCHQCATLLPNVLLNMIKLMWHSHCSLKTALQLLGLQIEVSNLHNSRGIQIPAKVWYSDVHIHNLRMYITKIWNLRFELIACVYKVGKLNNSTFAFSKVWCSDMGSIQ